MHQTHYVGKYMTRNGHHCGTASQNGRHRRERTAFLKKQEKCDRARADADAGEQRIIKPGQTELLAPTSAKPEKPEINQDRQRGASLDHESAKTLSDPFGGKPGKDLVRAVKQSR